MPRNKRITTPSKLQLVQKLFFGLTLALSSFLVAVTAPTPVAAQTLEWSKGCVYTQGTVDGAPVATLQGLECLVANIFIVFITLIGFAGFVMFIIAAFRWMTSGGNTKGVETARNTMTFVVIGIVVALAAYIIINLLAAFTGINIIREFRIPNSNTEYTVPATGP